MHLLFRTFLALRAVVLIAGFLGAMTPTVLPQDQSLVARYTAPTIVHLGRSSGYIFLGTVKSVSMVNPTSRTGVETVRITFHVENAVRGVRRGQILVIREWAGLWESGEHYRVGERVMLFLFPPGKLGLTSPVGGRFGKFALDAYGHVLLNREHIAAVSADPVLLGPWQGRTRMGWREFSRGILRASRE